MHKTIEMSFETMLISLWNVKLHKSAVIHPRIVDLCPKSGHLSFFKATISDFFMLKTTQQKLNWSETKILTMLKLRLKLWLSLKTVTQSSSPTFEAYYFLIDILNVK